MTADIVTRLRKRGHFSEDEIKREAADEIERLRALLDKWDEREKNLHLISLSQIVAERDALRAEVGKGSVNRQMQPATPDQQVPDQGQPDES